MDILNQEDNYIYEIKDISIDNSNNKCLIKSKIRPQEMKNLIFYIQYKYKSIIKQDFLTVDEIKRVLVKCYEVENCDCMNADEIINVQSEFKDELYNEEQRSIINDASRYETKGLIEELQEIVYFTIETWR